MRHVRTRDFTVDKIVKNCNWALRFFIFVLLFKTFFISIFNTGTSSVTTLLLCLKLQYILSKPLPQYNDKIFNFLMEILLFFMVLFKNHLCLLVSVNLCFYLSTGFEQICFRLMDFNSLFQINYCTCVIICSGLFIFYPLFHFGL